MAVEPESSECVCVVLSLAALTIVFGGLLALVIYQHSKEVAEKHAGGKTEGTRGDDDVHVRPIHPLGSLEPAELHRSDEADAAAESVHFSALSQQAEEGSKGNNSSGSGTVSRHDSLFLKEISLRLEEARKRPLHKRGPMVNRLLSELLGTGIPEAYSSQDGADRSRRRMLPDADVTAAPLPSDVAYSRAPGRKVLDAGERTRQEAHESPSPANSSSSSELNGTSGGSTAGLGGVWTSVTHAFHQAVELKWLVVAVAATAATTLAFSAAIVAAAVRRGRSTFSAPAWWSNDEVKRKRGRHADWRSLLESSDDDDDSLAASRKRKCKPRSSGGPSDVRSYLERLRDLDRSISDSSMESAPIATKPRKYDSTSK